MLQSCDEFKVVSEFLAIIKCQDKCSVNKNIRDALKTLSQKTPKKSDNEVLFIEQLKDRQDEGENLYNVYLLDRSDKKNYSIEAVPWDEVLGYAVDEASIAKYGDVKFTALVLYEMTYFGFSEKQIQNTIKAFNDDEALYPKAGKCHLNHMIMNSDMNGGYEIGKRKKSRIYKENVQRHSDLYACRTWCYGDG